MTQFKCTMRTVVSEYQLVGIMESINKRNVYVKQWQVRYKLP